MDTVYEETLQELRNVQSIRELCQLCTITKKVVGAFKFSVEGNLANLPIDRFALRFVPEELEGRVPLVSTGNGSCLFNSVSMLMCGTERLSQELRVRTIVEMSLNMNTYIHSKQLQLMVKAEDLLLQPQSSKYATDEELDLDVWRISYEESLLEFVHSPSAFADTSCISALANVLMNPIFLVYPEVSNPVSIINFIYIYSYIGPQVIANESIRSA